MSDGLDYGEQVFSAMVDLAHQQVSPLFSHLTLANIAYDGRRPQNRAVKVSERGKVYGNIDKPSALRSRLSIEAQDIPTERRPDRIEIFFALALAQYKGRCLPCGFLFGISEKLGRARIPGADFFIAAKTDNGVLRLFNDGREPVGGGARPLSLGNIPGGRHELADQSLLASYGAVVTSQQFSSPVAVASRSCR